MNRFPIMRWAVTCAAVLVLALACTGGQPAPPPPSGETPAAATRLWCKEHGLYEDKCTLCHPELIEGFKKAGDWCAEHGVPESVCPQCGHGEAPPAGVDAAPSASATPSATPRLWCKEHGLYEDKCTLCHPELAEGFKKAGDWCVEHGVPESVCPQCGHGEAPPAGETAPQKQSLMDPAVPRDGLPVILRAAHFEEDAGIRTVPARAVEGASGLHQAPAEIAFDPARHLVLRAPAAGVVADLQVQVGDVLAVNATLGRFESAAFAVSGAAAGAAASDVRALEDRVATEKRLFASGATSAYEVQDAERQLAAARAALRASAAPGAGAGAGFEAGGKGLRMRAPFAATVIALHAAPGEQVAEGAPLVTIADPAARIVTVYAPAAVAAALHSGDGILFRADGSGLETRARLAGSGAGAAHPGERVPLRATLVGEVPAALVAGTPGRAFLGTGAGVAVPAAALQQVAGVQIVFVRTGPATFVTRHVTVGPALGVERVLLTGVKAGEAVVTDGAYLLKTETMRDAIGAGCCPA